MSGPRLALIGLGRMGAEIKRLAAERGWPVVAEIGAAGNSGGSGITREALAGVDVALEFTRPESAADNLIACARAGCPVVTGTTGWLDRLPEVTREVEQSGGALLWAANFSVGVNILWAVAARAAELAAASGAFEAHIMEAHHAGKRDAPSGTALELARIASAPFGRHIPITSIRVGSMPGTHELLFDGRFEQLRIEHLARDRRVFAEGALLAAQWLITGRRVGVFTMQDVFGATSGTAQ